MKKINLTSSFPEFEDWRNHSRNCLLQGYRPDQILWHTNEIQEQDLFFQSETIITSKSQSIRIKREFLEMAQLALHHKSPDRFALLYRILWRLSFENKDLLNYKTDTDILKLQSLMKAVRRDAYKIKAFLRFRSLEQGEQEYFVAWYEPEHYSLELSLPFFQTRFKNMTWSILTPYLAAHWNQEKMTLCKNPDPSFYPKEDEIEKYWLKYYASTFNPARPKKSAMLNQMPKKYWKNMPETVLIKDLLQTSHARTQSMIIKK